MSVTTKTNAAGTTTLVHHKSHPLGLLVVMGINTGSGKTTVSNALAALFHSTTAPVAMLRIETAERRREFPNADLFIDVGRASEAANLIGGAAGLFDEVWPNMSETIAAGGIALVDCGAGAQNLFLRAAAEASLSALLADQGNASSIIVVTTPEPECGRQAVRLVADARNAMPGAQLVLAVNQVSEARHTNIETPTQRAFNETIGALTDVARLDVPFARGQALQAFGKAPILQVLRASEEQVTRWSGKGTLSSRAAQASLGAWYGAIADRCWELYAK